MHMKIKQNYLVVNMAVVDRREIKYSRVLCMVMARQCADNYCCQCLNGGAVELRVHRCIYALL